MKNLKAPFLAFAFILLNIWIASADAKPPPPNFRSTARSASVQADGVEGEEGDEEDAGEGDPEGGIGPGGRKVPIDQNITILLISGLALGATVMYRKQTKKASN